MPVPTPEEEMLNWVEVDSGALRWNLRQFRERLGEKVHLAAVVKSNAYGHGLLEVAGSVGRGLGRRPRRVLLRPGVLRVALPGKRSDDQIDRFLDISKANFESFLLKVLFNFSSNRLLVNPYSSDEALS